MSVRIDADCPNCGESLVQYLDGPGLECPGCGWTFTVTDGFKLVKTGRLDLHLLNELRAENDLEPLSALPEQRDIED